MQTLNTLTWGFSRLNWNPGILASHIRISAPGPDAYFSTVNTPIMGYPAVPACLPKNRESKPHYYKGCTVPTTIDILIYCSVNLQIRWLSSDLQSKTIIRRGWGGCVIGWTLLVVWSEVGVEMEKGWGRKIIFCVVWLRFDLHTPYTWWIKPDWHYLGDLLDCWVERGSRHRYGKRDGS